MNITEVKVKLVESPKDRLKAFCSITIDDMFVVRDLKVIDGDKGPFVAMPSRKLTDRCPKCRGKNRLTARFCNECGARLRKYDSEREGHKRMKLHADIAHPVTGECRDIIRDRVLRAYEEEMERSKEPGYSPTEIYEASELFADAEHEIDAIERTEYRREDEERESREGPKPQEPERRTSRADDDEDQKRAQEESEKDEALDDDDPFGAGIL